jgi:hypothetical protein
MEDGVANGVANGVATGNWQMATGDGENLTART